MAEVRNTKQKEQILNYLEKHKNKHLTVQEIEKDLTGLIGTTTIYRIINNFIKEGQVLKIPLDSKQGFCYQYNPKNEECLEHYHLICEKCGKLTHFESETFSKTEKEALEKEEFSINPSKIVFLGECKNCKKGRNQE